MNRFCILFALLVLCYADADAYEGAHADLSPDSQDGKSSISVEHVHYYVNVHGINVSDALRANIKQYGEARVMQSFMDYIKSDVANNHGENLLSYSGANAIRFIARYFGHLPEAADYMIRMSKEYDGFIIEAGSKSTHSLATDIIFDTALNKNDGAHESLVKISGVLCSDYNTKRALYESLAYRYDKNIDASKATDMFGNLIATESDASLAKEIQLNPQFAGVRQAAAVKSEAQDIRPVANDNNSNSGLRDPLKEGSKVDAATHKNTTGGGSIPWIAGVIVLICGVVFLVFALKYKAD